MLDSAEDFPVLIPEHLAICTLKPPGALRIECEHEQKKKQFAAVAKESQLPHNGEPRRMPSGCSVPAKLESDGLCFFFFKTYPSSSSSSRPCSLWHNTAKSHYVLWLQNIVGQVS